MIISLNVQIGIWYFLSTNYPRWSALNISWHSIVFTANVLVQTSILNVEMQVLARTEKSTFGGNVQFISSCKKENRLQMNPPWLTIKTFGVISTGWSIRTASFTTDLKNSLPRFCKGGLILEGISIWSHPAKKLNNITSLNFSL